MIVVNFAHTITPAQHEAIERIAEEEIERIIDVATQFNPTEPFVPQARAVVEAVGLTAQEWQTERILVNPPSLASITALVIAELHGRMGYFPAILRLRPMPHRTPPQFEVAELLNLQAIRDAARQTRAPGSK